jgi:hypothetical protein
VATTNLSSFCKAAADVLRLECGEAERKCEGEGGLELDCVGGFETTILSTRLDKGIKVSNNPFGCVLKFRTNVRDRQPYNAGLL